MQRTGRKGHAQFRVVVQDSRRTPTSGKIVAPLGHYNPHTKETTLNKEKASFYLEHGAQPSERVARLFKAEGIKLPSWVSDVSKHTRSVKNADKRRSTRPAEEVVESTEVNEPVEEIAEKSEDATKTEQTEEIESSETEETKE